MNATVKHHPILFHMDLFTKIKENKYRQDFDSIDEARDFSMNLREQTAGVLYVEQRNTAVFLTVL